MGVAAGGATVRPKPSFSALALQNRDCDLNEHQRDDEHIHRMILTARVWISVLGGNLGSVPSSFVRRVSEWPL